VVLETAGARALMGIEHRFDLNVPNEGPDGKHLFVFSLDVEHAYVIGYTCTTNERSQRSPRRAGATTAAT
jgi:hypothetical protein